MSLLLGQKGVTYTRSKFRMNDFSRIPIIFGLTRVSKSFYCFKVNATKLQ